MSEHAELFGRAALVARDADRFNMVKELEEDERQALEYERDHKWHGPKMLWYSISLCAIGAATQGWDQTGSNGANLSFPQEFGLDEENSIRDQWIVGLVNSIIFLTAGLMSVTPSKDIGQLLIFAVALLSLILLTIISVEEVKSSSQPAVLPPPPSPQASPTHGKRSSPCGS